jgi:hypothetical protein
MIVEGEQMPFKWIDNSPLHPSQMPEMLQERDADIAEA